MDGSCSSNLVLKAPSTPILLEFYEDKEKQSCCLRRKKFMHDILTFLQCQGSSTFHPTGSIQGLHNIHGSFNLPNIPGAPRNTTMSNMPSSRVQQSVGNLSGGRFASNNLDIALSQISHGSSHGYSGMTNRGGMSVVGNLGYNTSTNGVGGSIPGILPTSAAIGNRNAVCAFGVSPILENAGPQITSLVGNIVGGDNIGRSMSWWGIVYAWSCFSLELKFQRWIWEFKRPGIK